MNVEVPDGQLILNEKNINEKGTLTSASFGNDSKKIATVGGQAVIEGVMMRGKRAMAISVLTEEGEILTHCERINKKETFINKAPIFRGAVAFFDSLILGVKTLMKSAEVESGEEITKGEAAIFWLSAFLGLALGIGLFILLPSFLSGLIIQNLLKNNSVLILSLVEAAIRLAVMLLYMWGIAFLKSMKRTYMFHGAEHKTINCYEKGCELSVEQIQKSSRFHARCGTSFLFLVILVSIVFFSLVNYIVALLGMESNMLLRLALRLALLPLVAGISYEVLRALAKGKDTNLLIKILRAPGMALQRITTREPDSQMILTAVTAFNKVMAMEENPSIKAHSFYEADYNETLSQVRELLANCNMQGEAEFLMAQALNVGRDELKNKSIISFKQAKAALEYAALCVQGAPLERVIQSKEFYGRVFTLNDHTLIPRSETELVCEQAIKALGSGEGKAVLDLCAGSGCLGLTIAKETGASIVLADISAQCLEAIKQNAGETSVELVQSDMFRELEGRKFDLIVCNPPYVKTGDLAAEPQLGMFDPLRALDGGEDGLDFYRILASETQDYLLDGGKLVLEVGYDTGSEAARIFESNDWSTTLLKDYSSNDRILICSRKD